MSLCEVRCCCTAAVGVSVYCAGALKFRKRVQDGTRNMRAHREAPFVAVTKGRPGSAAAVAATTYKWLERVDIDTQQPHTAQQKGYSLHRSKSCFRSSSTWSRSSYCLYSPTVGSMAHTHTPTHAEALLFMAVTKGQA